MRKRLAFPMYKSFNGVYYSRTKLDNTLHELDHIHSLEFRRLAVMDYDDVRPALKSIVAKEEG